MSHDGKWQFWIDRGGTFTDVIARDPDGRLSASKLLSVNPDHYADSAIEGIRRMLRLAADQPIPSHRIHSVRMGTTVATNALLERKGEPVLLLTTAGFADALAIGYQNRPRLFDLRISRPDPLYDRVAEVDERIASDGSIVREFDEAGCRAALKDAFEQGIRSVAIVFVHGYRFPDHEAHAADIAGDIGFEHIAASHRISPLVKFVSRGDTTVVDAYLTPVLARYIDQVREALGGVPLYFMQSSGGLAEAGSFAGKDAILSGPAGGIVGAAEIGKRAGFDRVIAFDMGGTSTDVSHYQGVYERVFESQLAGVRLKVPMLDINTVAAGGGSICHFDGERYRVGPASAGAQPGPAAYGRGGPLTVTDCNLLTGRLQPDLFPSVFGESGSSALDRDAAMARLAEVGVAIEKATGERPDDVQIAEGFLKVAVEHMARAIKKISIERGHDVKNYCLVSFGGAGGQHACRVADALGMTSIVIHPLAGLLSALGIGLADLRQVLDHAVGAPLDEQGLSAASATLETLEDQARSSLVDQGGDPDRISVMRRLHLHYRGSDTTLLVAAGPEQQVRTAFEDAHRRQFGFAEPDREIAIEAVQVEAVARSGAEDFEIESLDAPDGALTSRRLFCGDAWHNAAVWHRHKLPSGQAIAGPALIVEPHSTIIVERGWRIRRSDRDDLVLTRQPADEHADHIGTEADPVLLEIFNNLFMSVAEQMGAVLEKTAHSVNMKERLDFSCAVFDPHGDLVANAPHMPVHLGSMGESVRTVISRHGARLRPGDVYVLNDPYHGGTHLPDITVVTPVFLESSADQPNFYVASRGHHADIGGLTPGSMPPSSRNIDDEGVLLDSVALVRDGRFREAAMRDALMSTKYPARNPDQNIADLKAQVAANETGVREVRRLVEHYGRPVVEAYMSHVKANAEQAVRRVIDVLEDGAWRYPLDNGAEIAVAIRVDHDRREATIDFTGTSAQTDDNFNAPKAVSIAAVLYVFRCLVADEIPLNEGCLAPLTIIVPKGSLLNPEPPAAVVAGNVETSQAVTNALFLALGRLAAAQGTMNNLTFGNDRHQYYETLCGGAGAGDGFDGASAVHTHMTNSRLTDVEVLEGRYPVRLERFAIRMGSGGAGRWKGGDGVDRKLLFLEEMDVSILANHREIPPPGLRGGQPGDPGKTTVIRADGRNETLAYADHTTLFAGDAIIIQTPGGGGFGKETS